jgi:hypothetical protein
MNVPCICGRWHLGDYQSGDCRLCWLRATLPAYRSCWRESLPDCRYRGEPCGETISCTTCGPRSWRWKVYTCQRHGRCLLGPSQAGLSGCRGCVDFLPRQLWPAPQRWNLVFHLYPLGVGSFWLWHVQQLRRFRPLFQRVLVAVALDEHTAPEARVRQQLADLCDQLWFVPNHPLQRDSHTWRPLLAAVASTDPREATLWGQSKAVTRLWGAERVRCRLWAKVLWGSLVAARAVVQQRLQEYPVVGSLLRPGAWFPNSASAWHYSGSWVWFRHDQVFDHNWAYQDAIGVETWPSLHFGLGQAGCIFPPEPLPAGDAGFPYTATCWQWLLPAWQRWGRDHQVPEDLLTEEP